MRCTPVRCTPMRCTPHETHAYKVYPHEMYTCEMHVHEMHDCEVYAHERHICKMYAHEIHAYEVYPYEMHAREIYAHRSVAFWGVWRCGCVYAGQRRRHRLASSNNEYLQPSPRIGCSRFSRSYVFAAFRGPGLVPHFWQVETWALLPPVHGFRLFEY
jgi:hypothetical protein